MANPALSALYTLTAAVVMCALAAGALAQDLPLPRFVSLRAGEVNVRAGPGTTYPIRWVFVRAGLPVEITAEFENWRRIRDSEGAEGWVHQSLLSGTRTALIAGEIRTLWRSPEPGALPVLRAEAGVVGRLLECADAWCRLEIDGRRGWLPGDEIWGVYPGEAVN